MMQCHFHLTSSHTNGYRKSCSCGSWICLLYVEFLSGSIRGPHAQCSAHHMTHLKGHLKTLSCDLNLLLCMTLSTDQTVWHWMVWWLLNSGLERIWKEVVVTNLRYYPSISVQRVRRSTRSSVTIGSLPNMRCYCSVWFSKGWWQWFLHQGILRRTLCIRYTCRFNQR
jgi:hypothetical protein